MSAADVVGAMLAVREEVAQGVKEYALQQEPVLVAVSKTKPKELLQACYDNNQRHFGENYVQEVVDKAAALPGDIRWHYIGHLQSNKVKKLLSVPNLWVVETVDSAKLARELNKVEATMERKTKLKVLVQVNTSGEVQKSGVAPGDAVELVRFIVDQCPLLDFQGLMTIGRFDESPKDDCFGCLASCKRTVCEALQDQILPAEDFTLSMGMSADFKLAMRLGSTSVRVGSTIFGRRAKKPVAAPDAPAAPAEKSAEVKADDTA